MYQTTITSWALLVAKAISNSDHNSQEIFDRAGLDFSKLHDPNARYSYQGMTRLWRMAREVTCDPCIGIKAASYWHPTTLHALGYAWMASGTLKEALERTVRYLHIVSTATGLFLEQQNDTTRLVFPNIDDTGPATEAMDAAFAVLVDMCRTSYGPEFRPVYINMNRSQPECEMEFTQMFGIPVNYSSSENAIGFSNKDLNRILPTANAELARVNDRIVAQYLLDLDKDNIVSQVKYKIIQQLPSATLTEELIAKSLNKSLRSLQRKLTEQNISYKELLDTTRQELAFDYIRDNRYSINEITYLLGFSEPSNFSRAFKRWTGRSPSAHRASLIAL